VDLCPKTTKKNEEKLKILEKWVFGFLWGKTVNGGQWWPAVGYNGGERPAVGRGWWVCNGWRWVRRIWMFGRRRDGDKGKNTVLRYNEMGKNGKKNDLKIGPEKAQLECVRMYISTFDRTRA
jgi:hypothetical protein